MMKSPSFKKYVLLSVVVHVLVIGGLYLFGELDIRNNQEQKSVSIDLITPEDLAKMQAAEQLQAGKKKPVLAPMNQIVEQNEKSLNEEENDSRFLSAKNQKVTKQTVAAAKGQFQNLKKAAPPNTGPKGDGKAKAEAKAESKVRESDETIAKELFKQFDPSAAMERQKQKAVSAKEAGLGEGRGNGELDETKGAETSQTNDYIKDVDNGLETMLNTREFKYYSYYNRIRRQLAQHWEGRVREKLTKMFKEGRSPAATNSDRITKLMIVLNDKGTLMRVQVLMDSGVRDLDDAAVEAFRAAAPFPNPPKGIIEGDGTVKIRWDFVLES